MSKDLFLLLNSGKHFPVNRGRSRIPRRMIVVPPPKRDQPTKAHEPQPPPAGAKKTPLIPHPPGRMIYNYTLDSYVPVQWKE